jgi:hypothetical protein
MVCLAGITGYERSAQGLWRVSKKEMLDRIKDSAEVFELGTITGIREHNERVQNPEYAGYAF